MWNWYIVIVISVDYYTYYEGYDIVKARSYAEAARKTKTKSHQVVEEILGPFSERPGSSTEVK